MKVFKLSSIAIVLTLVATTVFAQTRTDAVKAYNAGLDAANANNFDEAIASFTQALTIAEQIGPEGEDIKDRAETQIPTVYFKKAVSFYNTFKQTKDLTDLNNTINAFQDAVEVGDEYSDTQITPKAKGIIPQLYYQKSIIYFKDEEFEKASDEVDKAINLNSNYALAYYHKAKILKKDSDNNGDGIIDENVDELLNWYDRAIQIGDATGKTDVSEKAREAAHDELLAVGTRASEDGNISYALQTLEKALNYNAQSADVYYRLAEAHNKVQNPEEAVAAATKSLEYENGGRTDKAKIYFELGFAHQTLGNKAEACDAFNNALFGSFKSPAEHKMEYELKCDSTAN